MNITNIHVSWNKDAKPYNFIRWSINERPYTLYPYGTVNGSFCPDFHFKNNRIKFNRTINWFTL